MFGEVFAQAALAAFFALTGQQLVRYFVQGDFPQYLLRHNSLGKHHCAGEHHFHQRLVIVFFQIGVHGAERVIPRLVAPGYLIHIYILIVILLPARQDPVSPEYITHTVLAAAEGTGVTPQRDGQVVVEGIGDGCSEAKTMMKKPDEKERLKAAELLGKRYGLYSDKVNIDGAVPIVFAGEDGLED